MTTIYNKINNAIYEFLYFDDNDYNEIDIDTLSISILLTYMNIKPAIMPFSGRLLKNISHDSIKYKKFQDIIRSIDNLDITYDLYSDSLYNNCYTIIIFNKNIEKIYDNLLNIKNIVSNHITNNITNNKRDLIIADYHIKIGKILGYLYQDSPAKIRSCCNFYVYRLKFIMSDYDTEYYSFMCPYNMINDIPIKLIELLPKIKEILIQEKINCDIKMTIEYHRDI
jgi:hypothetical protein